ncbi:MAG: hypothetical protein K8T91_23770 [Planctomycetes bacterium]|nr:hypothetical protein [Planctomycetota bacterium]
MPRTTASGTINPSGVESSQNDLQKKMAAQRIWLKRFSTATNDLLRAYEVA